ncbi:MAG: hypothetical protein ACOYNY_04920 [Caldilineaceae bacterium]
MPRQNRVTPFSELIATPARGSLMGNRGCLHDSAGNIRRAYQGKRWIICLLEFKNRRRMVMTPGQYTELFFLDEATALAAGHRPCAECQRERFNHFRTLWATANPHLAGSPKPAATVIDAILHQERLQRAPEAVPVAELPDGAFVTFNADTQAYLIYRGGFYRWQPTGYTLVGAADQGQPAHCLTPTSIVRTLAAGYEVQMATFTTAPAAE